MKVRRFLHALGRLLPLLCVAAATLGTARPATAQGPLAATTIDGVEMLSPAHWRSGDRPSWAAAGVGLDEWNAVGLGGFPTDAWREDDRQVGWLRFRVRVDPELHGEVLGLYLEYEGAAEVYVDGELLHRYGRVGDSAADEVYDRTQDPRPLIFPRSAAGDGSEHVIAVRYSSRHLRGLRWVGVEPHLELRIGALRPMVERRVMLVRLLTFHQMFLTGTALAFALVHLMLFVFRPRTGPNLYFALLALSAAATVFLMFGTFIQRRPEGWLLYFTFYLLAFLALALSSLRFVYALSYPRRPRLFLLFVLAGLGLGVYAVVQPEPAQAAVLLFMLAANAEIVRAAVASWASGFDSGMDGDWIIGLGAIPLVVVSPYQLLVGLGVLPKLWDFLEFPAPYYALVVLMFSMSVYLGRNFARTQTRLERELRRVQLLSEEKLEQERLAREKEVERARLEAENRRRAYELEEARSLQVSMLPREVPAPEGWQLAVHQSTATEVGGDYYDFLPADGDDALTVIVGDATGHGAQAGSIVAATKGMLWARGDGGGGDEPEQPAACLSRVSAGLRHMGLRRRHMALVAARVEPGTGRVVVAAAAMPPILIYRAASPERADAVETIEFHSLPLGSFRREIYEQTVLEVKPGDRLLLMTDGLPESTDAEGASLGYMAVETALRRHGAGSPDALIEALLELAREWSGTETPEDDLTLLVLGRSRRDS